MALLLITGAICDHLCQEVPDDITVPFAMLGTLTAAYQGRWLGALITVLLTLAVQVGYQPKLFKWLSDRIIRRAYGDADTVAEVEADINQKSDLLYEKYGEKIVAVGLFVFIATTSAAGAVCVAKADSMLSRVVGVAAAVFVIGYYFISGRMLNKTVQEDDTSPEHEELTALGGADVLVFIGLFGYFGLVNGVYAITAILLGVLILYVIRAIILRIMKKGKTAGFPLLPYFTACVPLGVLSVIYIAWDTAELFADAFQILRLL